MEDLDTDHDGFINLSEFAAFCRSDTAEHRAPRCLQPVRSGQERPHIRHGALPGAEPPRNEVLRGGMPQHDQIRGFRRRRQRQLPRVQADDEQQSRKC
ncbi:hypothetical protein glysoja_028686 [Glycine soja]|uniref:EF-hand domain-containing protein n=1 Tax=Glycine soja TaxID=3848 RepID=A0A0B2NY63_GLYSO|nr:hypothetical protein glysoja_028686 [Glycine soja]